MEIIIFLGLTFVFSLMAIMLMAASMVNTGVVFHLVGLFTDATRCRERIIVEAVRPGIKEKITFSRFIYATVPWAIVGLALGGTLSFFLIILFMAYSVLAFNKVL